MLRDRVNKRSSLIKARISTLERKLHHYLTLVLLAVPRSVTALFTGKRSAA